MSTEWPAGMMPTWRDQFRVEALSLNEKISISYTCTIYFFLLFAYLFLKKKTYMCQLLSQMSLQTNCLPQLITPIYM